MGKCLGVLILSRPSASSMSGAMAWWVDLPLTESILIIEKYYSLHIACDNGEAAGRANEFIRAHLYVKIAEDMIIKDVKAIKWHPLLKLSNLGPTTVLEERSFMDSFMKNFVFNFNNQIKGAFVMSCVRNMGTFEGVGFPEDIGEFFCLDKIKAPIWLVHNRFPTNSQSWW